MPRAHAPKDRHPALFIQTEGLSEVGRLACALERYPLPVFRVPWQSTLVLAAQLDLHMGAPIFYYAPNADPGSYLGYRTGSTGEEVVVTRSATNPSFQYSPIVAVKSLPRSLRPRGRNQRHEGIRAVELEELGSLARVSAYKMLFEEPPLPVFLFPDKRSWIMGTFTRMDEFEESALFFYVRSEEKPTNRFIRYDPHAPEEARTTNRTDEHGSIYIKMVALTEVHPLAALE